MKADLHWFQALLRGVVVLMLAAPLCAAAASDTATDAQDMTIEVDVSNVGQKLVYVKQRIPVRSGPLRLNFPRWLPGFHGPYGDVTQIAGLEVQAAGKRIAWKRDPADPFGFIIDVPPEARAIELSFQSMPAPESQPYRSPWTRELLGLQWHAVVLYPSGRPASAIGVAPSVRLPTGWGYGSALRVRGEREGWLDFERVSLETLIDSPLYAAQSYRRIELDAPGAAWPAALHLFSDQPERLQPSEAQIEAHRALVRQGTLLFGSRPWRHYDLLIATGEGLPRTALEHQQSSENVYPTDYFKDWPTAARRRDDVAHEFVHAWNGKYRRPADLWARDFNSPSQNSLLWVYEGLTQYYGMVLATRSGLVSPELMRRDFGRSAAYLADLPGRRWRNLQDTTNDPSIASSADRPWSDWQRGWDFYYESALLIWLDADTLIRAETSGARSLDDFARTFFAGADGERSPSLYKFDDVVTAMNSVHPHDWKAFFRLRLDRTVDHVALDGLERSGWRVAFVDKRSEMDLAALDPDKPTLGLGYSLGVGVDKEGALSYVFWHSPAFRNGLAPQDKIVAVGMRAYTSERLEAAVMANRDGTKPITLLIKRGDEYRTVVLDVRTGLRYPTLEKIEGRRDLLTEILAPK